MLVAEVASVQVDQDVRSLTLLNVQKLGASLQTQLKHQKLQVTASLVLFVSISCVEQQMQ